MFTTSLPDALDHGAGMPGLVVALIVIGLGYYISPQVSPMWSLTTDSFGGIKSNVGPLIAEQNAGRKPYIKEELNGERLIVDPNITIQSIYNIYYW